MLEGEGGGFKRDVYPSIVQDEMWVLCGSCRFRQ